MAKTAELTVRAKDVPEVQRLIEAVLRLPIRWSDRCGECPWCRLDKAMADLGVVIPHV